VIAEFITTRMFMNAIAIRSNRAGRHGLEMICAGALDDVGLMLSAGSDDAPFW
jgi:hypothetical protein